MTKPMWKPLAEMDMDDGTHTCYYWETDSHYCYLTQISDGTWDIVNLCLTLTILRDVAVID